MAILQIENQILGDPSKSRGSRKLVEERQKINQKLWNGNQTLNNFRGSPRDPSSVRDIPTRILGNQWKNPAEMILKNHQDPSRIHRKRQNIPKILRKYPKKILQDLWGIHQKTTKSSRFVQNPKRSFITLRNSSRSFKNPPETSQNSQDSPKKIPKILQESTKNPKIIKTRLKSEKRSFKILEAASRIDQKCHKIPKILRKKPQNPSRIHQKPQKSSRLVRNQKKDPSKSLKQLQGSTRKTKTLKIFHECSRNPHKIANIAPPQKKIIINK